MYLLQVEKGLSIIAKMQVESAQCNKIRPVYWVYFACFTTLSNEKITLIKKAKKSINVRKPYIYCPINSGIIEDNGLLECVVW
jgi:hypothetical protein